MSNKVQKHSAHTFTFSLLKHTHNMFLENQTFLPILKVDTTAKKIRRAVKTGGCYGSLFDRVQMVEAQKVNQVGGMCIELTRRRF